MKLSLLPLSNSALTCNPLRDTIAEDFAKDTGFLGETVANVGDQNAADVVGLVTSFPRQTFAKCPFLWHFKQMASRAGHFDRACLLFPQKKQDALPSVGKAANEGGSKFSD